MPDKMFVSWLKKLMGTNSRRARRSRVEAPRLRAAKPWRPTIDVLEDRIAPASWLVTLSTDAATPTAGMLRYAVNNSVAGDQITFASALSGSTITLVSTLAIAHNLTIVGLGASSLTISGTNASFGAAGNISVASGVTASISGLKITNGLATQGSGIKNAGTLSLSDDIIANNGAIGNTTNNYGAGIYNTGTLGITGTTISGNTTYTDGGGIYNSGTLSVTDSTIQGNAAYTYGGGIYQTGGTLTLSNDTISGNTRWNNGTGVTGGGIYVGGGTVTMINTIVAGNTTGSTTDVSGTLAIANNDLIGVNSGVTITSGSGNLLGVASGLNALGSNGGPTQTMSLATGSAAIGAGGAVTTVPAAGIAATGNSITVTNGAAIGVTAGVAVLIRIDNEQMLVTSVAANVLTVVRGYNGTAAASHASGAGVFLYLDQRGYSTTTTTPDIGAYQTTGTAPLTPTVTTVSVHTAPLAGGTSVTIAGTNLQNATTASFGGLIGTIVSNSGTAIVATTPAGEAHALADTTVTTVGWDTTATSAADQILFGPLYADGLAAGALTITEEVPAINANLQMALSGGNYTFTDTSGYLFDVATGSGAASITGTGTATITIPAASVTSISVVLGTGTNVFTLTGTASTAAPLTVNAGTTTGDQVIVSAPVSDTGAVSLTANTITQTAAGLIAAGAVSLTAASIGTAGQSLALNATSLTANTSASNGNQFLTDSGTVLLPSAGALNAGTGTITLTSGTFKSQAANAITATGNLVLPSPAILDMNGNSQGINVISGTGTVTDSGAAATLTINGASTFVGNITGANAGLTLAASVTLSGSNTYGGATSVQNGTLKAGANNAFSASSAVTLGTASTAGTLDLGGFNESVGGLSIAAGATAANQTVGNSSTTANSTLTVTAGTTTFAGIIKNTLGTGTQTTALTVTGGSLTLTGADTYTGPTAVSGGTLLVNTPSALASTVAVSGTGTLGGTSAVGAITGTGGTVNPGSPASGIGILTAPSLNLSGGGNLTLEVAGVATAGTSFDQLNLGTGTLTLGGTSSLTLDMAGLATTGTITAAIVAGTITGAFNSFNIINASGYAALQSISGNVLTITIYIQAATSIVTTSGSGQSATVNTPFASSIVATVLDQHGAPMSGQTVTFTAPSSGATAIFSNSTNTISGPTNGLGQLIEPITASTVTGSYIISAAVALVSTPTTFSLTNTAAAPATIVIVSGGPQSAVVNTAFAPLVVLVADTFGNAVPSASVTFTAPSSGASGAFSNSTNTITASTNASGQLSEAFTASTLTGSYTVTAAVGGVSTPANFSLTNTAGAATHLVVTTQPSSTATAGVAFAVQPVVAEEDAYNNILTADSTHTVTAARGSLGTASLLGSPLTVSLVNGVATFSGLVYDKAETMNLGFATNAGAFTVNSSSIVVSPNVTAQVGIIQQPSNTTAGAAINPVVKAAIEDAYGNPEPSDNASTLSIAINTGPAGGVFTGSSTTVAVVSAGVATFSSLVLNTAGSYTLKASDALLSYTSAPSNSFVVSPNTTAAQLVFGVQPTNTTAGAAISPAVTVKIEDQFGNVETSDNASSLSIAIASGPPGAAFAGGSTTAATVSAGVATFTTLKLNTAGVYALQATDAAPALTSSTSNSFVVTPGAATQLAFGTQPTITTAGAAISPAVTVKIEDAYGNVETSDNASSLSVAIASGPTGAVFAGGSTTTATVVSGVATFTTLKLNTAGSYTLNASDASPALTSPASNSFVVSPGAATQLVFGQQPTNATAGAALAPAVTVKIEDVFGNVETNDYSSSLSVAVASGTGGFTGSSATAVTVIAGVATFGNLVLNTAGGYTLQASDATPALNTGASNSFVVSPASAAKLVFGQQPTNTTAGVAINPVVTVKIEDTFGNVETSDSASSLSLAIASGPASASFASGSTTTVTVSAGVATFTTLKLNTAGSYTLQASDAAPTLSSPASNTFVVSPGSATQLVFGQQPTNTVAGIAISPPVSVKIEDAFGNVETSDNASSLSIAIASGPTGGTFASGSTVSATVSAGVATFTTLKLNTAGNYTLQASDAAPALTSAASNAFVVTPNTATQLIFTQQPTNTTAGVAINPALTVTIKDIYGNVETTDNLSSLSLTFASGPGSVFAAGSQTTAVVSGGVATFGNVVLNAAGAYTLKASDGFPALTSAASNNFTVSPAAATQLAFGVQPTNTTAGVALSPAVTVKIEDPFGNVETSDNASSLGIAIAGGPPGSAFAPGSTTTATVSAGVATFTTLQLNTAGSYTLKASDTAPALSSPVSSNFVVSPNAATQLVFGQQPTNISAGIAITPAVTVKIEDVYGNVETGDNATNLSIAIASGPAGGVFASGSTAAATVSAGVATFNNLVLDATGNYTLKATDASPALTSPASNSFVVSPNNATAAAQLVFAQQPTNATAGVSISPAVSVKIEDQFGNVITSDNTSTVTLAIASGPAGGAFAGTSTITATANAGVATFGNLVLDTAGAYTLQASDASPALTSAASSSFVVSPSAAAKVVFGQPPTSATAGLPLVPTVTALLEDTFGNVETGDSASSLTLAIASGPAGAAFASGSTTTVTVSAGIAVFTTLLLDTAGAYTLQASDASPLLVSAASNNFVVAPNPTATQLIFSQQPTNVTAGVASAPTVTVKIEDIFGNVETGDSASSLSLAIASGPAGATFASGSTVTATVSAGVAVFPTLVFDTAGNYTLKASDASPALTVISNSFVVSPGTATQLIFSQQPTTTTAGAAINPAVTVTIEDVFGNVEINDNTSSLGLAIASGPAGAAFASGSATTAVASGGVATFSNLVLNTAGVYTLQAIDGFPVLSSAASSSFVVSPNGATQLVFATQPSNAIAGFAISPVVTVNLEDAFGNVETNDSTSSLSVAIASGPSGASFTPGSTTTATVSAGVASFTNLTLNTAGVYALQAADATLGLSSPTSLRFVIGPGAAAQLVFGQQPTNTKAGVTLAPTVTAKIEDALGNVETADNTSALTLAIASGPAGGTFATGSATTATANAGIVTFNNVAFDTAGVYTLKATDAAPALTSPASSSFVIAPNSATQLVFGQQPTNAVVAAVISPAVTLKIEDAYGNLETSDYASSVSISPASGPGGFSSASTTSAIVNGGVATFGNLAMSVPGTYTLRAAATGGLTSPASSPFLVTPNQLHLTFVQQPTNAVAGQAVAPVTVDILDQYNALNTGDDTDQVTLSIVSGPGGFAPGSITTITASGGVAIFNSLVFDVAGTYVLSENTPSATGPNSSSFTITAAGANHLAFGIQPGAAIAGIAINPTVNVQVLDPYGNLVVTNSTDIVTLAVASGPGPLTVGSTTVVTVTGGVAAFSNLVLDTTGAYTLRAIDTLGITAAISSTFVISPNSATQLVFGQQPTNLVAGSAVSPGTTVKIEDQYGNVETADNTSSLTIAIASGPAGGAFAAGSTTTVPVSAGVATFTALNLNTAGTYTLQASDASPVLTSAVSSSFTVRPAAATQIVFGQNPTNTLAGVPLSPTVTAKLEDAFGNVETNDSASSLTIAISSGPAGGTFASGSTLTAVVNAGVATFTGLTLDKAGTYTLAVTDPLPALTSSASPAFVVSPNTAAQLIFGQQPGNAVAGNALSPAVTVKIEDAYGNVETADNASNLVLAIASGPAGASFAGGSTPAATVNAGVATFTTLKFDVAGAYTLVANDAAPTLSSAPSGSFTISPNVATQLVFGQQPTATIAGSAISPAVTVKIEDVYGNVETADNASGVTLAIASGPAGGTFVSGSTASATVSAGVATFSNLILNTAGTYALSESTAGGLTGPNSTTFQVTPSTSGVHLAFYQQPISVVAGVAISPIVTVRILDQLNNVVATDNTDQVTLTIASGPGGFAGTSTTTVTAVNGIASFSNLVFDTAGLYTLQPSATGGLTGVASTNFTVIPAAAAHLAYSQQPTTTVAGVVMSPAVTVHILDAFNNLVTSDNTDQVTLAIASGPGGFATGSTTTVTASAGIATFSNLTLDTAGSYALSDSTGGGLTGIAVSSTFQVTPAAATHLAFGTQPSTTVAGVRVNPAVTVRVLDAFNNVVVGDYTDQVTLAIASGPGAFTSTSTATVYANAGIATFSNLVLDTTGAYTLSENATGGLTGSSSATFTVTPSSAARLAFSQQPGNTVAGTAITPAVSVSFLDAFNNLVTTDNSDQVTLAIASGPGGFTGTSTTTLTASGGVANFSNLVLDTTGVYVLSELASGGLTGPNSSSFTITPAAATHLAFNQQPTATAAGVALSPAVTVTILDAFNNVVTSDNSDLVSVSIGSGPGSFATGSTTTANAHAGIATFSNLVLDTAGTYSLNGSATGGLTGAVSKNFAISPNAASQLVFGQQPTGTTAGVALNPAVTVKIEDQYGNVETSDNASSLSIAIASGPTGAAFAAGSSATATVNAGVATFTTLILDTAGAYTLTAADAAPAFTSAASSAFTVSPNTATQLVFGQQPTNTTAGVALAPAVTVQIEDQFGNVETGDNASSLSVAIGSGPAGSSFAAGNSTSATVAAGVATFTTLTLDTAGAYVLTATDATPSLTSAGSSVFTVNPGAATHLAFSQQPTTTLAGAVINPALMVRIVDAFNNTVTSDRTDVITVAVASGPGSFTGTSTTAATASSGVATFSNLALGSIGTYTLSASAAGGVTGVDSNSFQVVSASAIHLAFGTSPGAAVAGVAINPVVTVRVLDSFNNLVSSDNTDYVTLAVASGPGSFAGTSTTSVMVSGGVATFSNLALDTAGAYTLLPSGTGGLTGAVSGSFTVSPAAAAHVIFSQQPSITAAGVAINPMVVVHVVDAFNNLVASDNTDQVTLAVASGPGSFTGGSTTTVTVSGGVATFSNLVLDTAGVYTLSDRTTSGLTGLLASNSFQVTPLAARQLAFGTQPGSTVAGIAINPAVTVRVLDSFGNLVTTDNTDQVTLTIAGGPGGFASSSTTAVTVSGGVATFGNLVLDTTGTYTLSESATNALTGPASASFQVTPATADHLAIGQQPGNTVAGVPLNPAVTVRVLDAFNNLVTTDNTDAVTLAIASGPAGFTGSSTTTMTASGGVAAFSNLVLDGAGVYVLGDSASGGLVGLNSNAFQVSPASAAHLVFSQQPGTTTAGAAVSPAVTVRILDAFNNLVVSDNTDQVSLTIASGPGSFTGSSTTTATATGGIATFSNLHLDSAGSYTLADAATGGLTGAASSSFVVTPAAATQLVFGQQPTAAAAGASLNPAVTVKIEDQFGNVETADNASGLTLAITTGPAGAVFAGGSTTNAVVNAGVATFPTLKFDTAGAYQLTATDAPAGLTSPASGGFTITPSIAAKLVFGQQPTNTIAGGTLNPAVTVKIEDQYGNVETSDNTSALSLAIASGPSGAAFAGGSTTSATVSAGVAAFTTVMLDSAGAYMLSASDIAPALTSADSNSFTVNPNTATHLAFGQQPSTTVAGAAITPGITVRVLDAFNNLVTTDNSDQVTLGVATGPGTITGASTTTAAVSGGVATFYNIALSATGAYTLSESTGGGLAGASSVSFPVVAATPTHLVFSAQPAATVAGVAISPAVTVRVLDSFNNLVSTDDTDQVTLTIASGPAGFAGSSTATVTVNGGIATFSNLVLDTSGVYTLSESATGGLAGPASSSFVVSPASATHLAFGQQPNAATAGVAINPAVSVRLLDAFNNLVSTDNSDLVTLAIASGPGGFTVGSTTTATATGGIATFNNLVLDTTGSYTLNESTAGGLEGTASNGFQVTPAAPTQLAFGTQPSATVAGVAINPPVTVRILDAFNNLVTTDNADQVTLTVASGPGGFASGSTTSVAVNGGIATFNNLLLDTAGVYTFSESATGGLTGLTSASFPVTPAAAARLVYSQQPGNTVAGVAINPAVSVRILDAFNNLVTTDNSDLITLAVASGPGAFAGSSVTTATASAGIATFSNLVLDSAGTYSLSDRTAGGLIGLNSNAFQITPASANHLAFTQQPGATSAGAAIDPAVTVRILDAFNNLVTSDSSDQVSLAIASGPGLFAPGSTTTATASAGVATFSNLLLDTAGSYLLGDSATGGLLGPASAAFTVNPTAATQLVFGQQPTGTAAGIALSPAVTVKLEDAYGNVETADNASNLNIAISSGPTGANFAGGSATSATVSAGVATFPTLKLNTAGVYQLTASDPALTLASAASSPFTVTPNAATQLVFGQQPLNTTAGVALNPAMSVKIEDAYGNVETGDYASTLSLAVATGPAGSNFAPGSTTNVTVSAGVATFTTLIFDTAGVYTLAASDAAPALPSVGSASFTVIPNSAAQLAFGQQPTTTSAGATINPGVTVRILDAFGNLVTADSSDQVTLAVASGPGGLTGASTTTATASAGVATFTNLAFNTAGLYALSESAGSGLAGPNSSAFQIAAATPTHLAFGIQPTNAIAGDAVNPAVTVRLLDRFNNLASNDNADQVTLVLASGPGAFAPTSTTTATVSGGVATFSNLILDTVGNYTLSESATGNLSGPASSSFQVAPAAATHLVFGTQPATSSVGAAINPAVTVRLLDPFNNLVTTDNADAVSITLAGGPGGFTSGSTTTVTASGGIATFANLVLNTASTSDTLVAAGSNLGNTSSNVFNVRNPVANIAVTSSLNPAIFGQEVDLKVTVTGIGATPGGAVTVNEGSATLAYGTLNSSGVATIPLTALPAGAQQKLGINYAGDGLFSPSSTTVLETVNQAATTTTMSPAGSSPYGQAVTFTANVAVVSPGAGSLAGGAVTFMDGSTMLGTGTLNANGQATFTTASLAAGAHSISAVYAATANFSASTASPVTQNVSVTSTTTTLAATTPASFGQPITFTATVVGATGVPAAGNVTFENGGAILGTGVLNSQGVATFTTVSAPFATSPVHGYLITAVYGGASNFLSSTSSAKTQIVNAVVTQINLTSSTNGPSVIGQSVTFTAAVTPSTAGAGTLTGKVTFYDNGKSLGAIALNGSGLATFTTSALTLANHTITAAYSGATNFAANTATLVQAVTPISTSINVQSSQSAGSTFGQAVTFTAFVAVSGPGAGKPTGTVSFYDQGKFLGKATLAASGQAAITVSTLLGNVDHDISAVYSGSANFASVSTDIDQWVAPAATTTSISTPAIANWTIGAPIVFTTKVASTNGLKPTGTVTLIIDGVAQSPVSLSAGSASLRFAGFTTPGVHTVSIAYTPDTTNYASSASTILTQSAFYVSTIKLSASSLTFRVGQPVTINAALTGTGDTPTGQVSFYDGTRYLGTYNLDDNGLASVTFSSLSAGVHNISATYLGDTEYAPKVSNLLSLGGRLN